MIVSLLSDIVVFVWTEPLQEICHREDCLSFERIILEICLLICVKVLPATTFVPSRFFLVSFKLFEDLKETVDGLALVVFVIHQAPLDQEFEKALKFHCADCGGTRNYFLSVRAPQPWRSYGWKLLLSAIIIVVFAHL